MILKRCRWEFSWQVWEQRSTFGIHQCIRRRRKGSHVSDVCGGAGFPGHSDSRKVPYRQVGRGRRAIRFRRRLVWAARKERFYCHTIYPDYVEFAKKTDDQAVIESYNLMVKNFGDDWQLWPRTGTHNRRGDRRASGDERRAWKEARRGNRI